MFPVEIGLRDPRSQKRDLGHPSISPFDIAEGTSFVISLPTRLSESAARDDKGKGNGSTESGCWTEAVFITLGGPQAHDSSGPTARRTGHSRVCAFLFKERRMRSANATKVHRKSGGSVVEEPAVSLFKPARELFLRFVWLLMGLPGLTRRCECSSSHLSSECCCG